MLQFLIFNLYSYIGVLYYLYSIFKSNFKKTPWNRKFWDFVLHWEDNFWNWSPQKWKVFLFDMRVLFISSVVFPIFTVGNNYNQTLIFFYYNHHQFFISLTTKFCAIVYTQTLDMNRQREMKLKTKHIYIEMFCVDKNFPNNHSLTNI